MRYCGEDTNCIEESGGHHWLNTRRLNEKLQELFNSHRLSAFERTTGISEPAGQADGGLTDIVPTLIGSAPLNAIDSYVLRPRSSWPSQIQLQEVKHLPMCSVLVGHQKSPMGARVSSSPGELILISKLSKSIKQGYIAAKYTLKHFLKKYRQQSETDDGRSHVGSYHLKTTLLYYLEKNPPHQIRSSFGMMKDLLQDLNIYVISRHLPNYFLSECNLLDTVGPDQLVIARKAICDILLDPVAAVLKCPSMPNQIYGDISPDDLVKAFRQVAARPSHEQGWEDLLRLLSCLDGSWWRHQMETFSALLAICAGNSPVPGDFPTQRPVTRSFDVFFDLRPNKRLSKEWRGWWFETPSHPLWRHRNGDSNISGNK